VNDVKDNFAFANFNFVFFKLTGFAVTAPDSHRC
jgi:hypothetical protein